MAARPPSKLRDYDLGIESYWSKYWSENYGVWCWAEKHWHVYLIAFLVGIALAFLLWG